MSPQAATVASRRGAVRVGALWAAATSVALLLDCCAPDDQGEIVSTVTADSVSDDSGLGSGIPGDTIATDTKVRSFFDVTALGDGFGGSDGHQSDGGSELTTGQDGADGLQVLDSMARNDDVAAGISDGAQLADTAKATADVASVDVWPTASDGSDGGSAPTDSTPFHDVEGDSLTANADMNVANGADIDAAGVEAGPAADSHGAADAGVWGSNDVETSDGGSPGAFDGNTASDSESKPVLVCTKGPCDDGNACTKESCDPKTGACKHKLIVGCALNAAACHKDADCVGGRCDKQLSACVACLTSADCPKNRRCRGGACAAVATCGSDVDCKTVGMVCDKQTAACVDCVDVGDCAADQLCVNNTCQTPAKPCTTSKQCPFVCDKVSAKCVECLTSSDCANKGWCSATQTCAPRICSASTCVGTTLFTCAPDGSKYAPSLCSDGNSCTMNSCTNKSCAAKPVPNGKPCGGTGKCKSGVCDLPKPACKGKTDGTGCGVGKICVANSCVGGTQDCTKSPAGSVCGLSQKCVGGKCVFDKMACAQLKDGNLCSDGNKCTTADKCKGGSCSGQAKSCDDSKPCTVDSCGATSGKCIHKLTTDGTACGAGSFCAAGTCTKGTCKPWRVELPGGRVSSLQRRPDGTIFAIGADGTPGGGRVWRVNAFGQLTKSVFYPLPPGNPPNTSGGINDGVLASGGGLILVGSAPQSGKTCSPPSHRCNNAWVLRVSSDLKVLGSLVIGGPLFKAGTSVYQHSALEAACRDHAGGAYGVGRGFVRISAAGKVAGTSFAILNGKARRAVSCVSNGMSVVVGGTTAQPAAGQPFIASMSASGKILWELAVPGPKSTAAGLSRFKDGSVMAHVPIKVALSVSAAGKMQWQKKPWGWSDSLAGLSTGLVGAFESDGKGATRVVAYDAKGTPAWTSVNPLQALAYPGAAVAGPGGSMYVAGQLTQHSGNMNVLVRLAPDGRRACMFGAVCSDKSADGVSCSDANACLAGSACKGGKCVVSDACHDKNDCTNDICDTVAGCTHMPIADGSDCVGGKCSGGKCKPVPVDIQAGREFTCVLEKSGTVRCWGINRLGQLGDGSFVDRNVPVAVQGVVGAKQLIVGDSYGCARTKSNVLCWGNNFFGQLGTGQTGGKFNKAVPVKGLTASMIGNVLVSGDAFTCTASKPLVCWGAHANQAKPVPTPTVLQGTKDLGGVSAGGSMLCGVVKGKVLCWQMYSGATNPIQYKGLTTVPVLGTGHSCFASSGLRCWGQNSRGQLGNGTYSPVTSPSKAWPVTGAKGPVVLAPGRTCTTSQCWGANAFGQIGNGKVSFSETKPVKTIAAQITKKVAVGQTHTCALTNTGGVRCWGRNKHVTLGNGATGDKHAPVRVTGISDAVAIWAGVFQTCARTANGSVACWGISVAKKTPAGWSAAYQQTPQTVSALKAAASVAPGQGNRCALLPGGTVKCWGSYFADKAIDYSKLTGAIAVDVGQAFGCALMKDATMRCWGNNFYGQLGLGHRDNTGKWYPVQQVSGLKGVKSISSFSRHTCALRNDGSVWCWGDNYAGQIGHGQTGIYVKSPAKVKNVAGATVMSVGQHHSCAVVKSGAVKCWGYGQVGQVAPSCGVKCNTAQLVPNVTGATALALGASHSCALLSGGRVRCWGWDQEGQMGDGPVAHGGVLLKSLMDVIQIAAGQQHTCALRKTGDVWCWGRNGYGEIGDGKAWYPQPQVAVGF